MPDYLSVGLAVFFINIVPIFMPPTWFILAMEKLKDPALDPLMLALVGAVASSLGRGVLAYYSMFFRRFFTAELTRRADEIRIFFDRKDKELFLGTFAYALTPFPSNVIFVADGLTKVDPKPLFLGFFLGRFISYYGMVALSANLFTLMSHHFPSGHVRMAFDVIGVLGAFSIILIDWKKVTGLKR